MIGGAATEVLGTLAVRLGADTTDLDRSLLRVGSTLKGLAGTLAASFTVGAMIKEASDFEDTFVNATANMAGMTKELNAQMKDLANTMESKLLVDDEALARGFQAMDNAGMNAAQSLAMMPAAATYAQAANVGLNEGIMALVKSMNALGLATGNATQDSERIRALGDVFMVAAREGAGTANEYASALQNRLGVQLKSMGISLFEGTSALMVMGKQQRSVSAGATQLIRVYDMLTRQNKTVAAEFKRTGVDVFDKTSGKMRNLSDIMLDMQKRNFNLNVFGSGARGGAGAGFRALMGHAEEMEKYEQSLRQSGGTSASVAEKRMETFITQSQQFWKAIKNIEQAFGTLVLPWLTKTVEGLERVAFYLADVLPKSASFGLTSITGAFKGFGTYLADMLAWILVNWKALLTNMAAEWGPIFLRMEEIFIRTLDDMHGRLQEWFNSLGPLGQLIGGKWNPFLDLHKISAEKILPGQGMHSVGTALMLKNVLEAETAANNLRPEKTTPMPPMPEGMKKTLDGVKTFWAGLVDAWKNKKPLSEEAKKSVEDLLKTVKQAEEQPTTPTAPMGKPQFQAAMTQGSAEALSAIYKWQYRNKKEDESLKAQQKTAENTGEIVDWLKDNEPVVESIGGE